MSSKPLQSSATNQSSESVQYSELQIDLMIGLYCHLKNSTKACQFIEMSVIELLESKQLKKVLNFLNTLIRKHFRPKQMTLSFELKKLFRVLQSYLLVKPFVVIGNHHHATGLLERAAQESLCIGRENHVALLTSLVIEAFKVGLKGLAYHWALHLCKPQNLELVNEKCRNKIQKVALRPVKLENVSDNLRDTLVQGLSLEQYLGRLNLTLGKIDSILKNRDALSPEGIFFIFLT